MIRLHDSFCPAITDEQAAFIGLKEGKYDVHGKMETVGMWQIPVAYTAMVKRGSVLYGVKRGTIPDPEDNVGGCLRVLVAPIGKRKVRGYTSSFLCNWKGNYYSIACISLTDSAYKLVEKRTLKALP